MTIQRRIEKLEAAIPEHPYTARVVFAGSGRPAPVVSPPLRPNELLFTVNFVKPGEVRHG